MTSEGLEYNASCNDMLMMLFLVLSSIPNSFEMYVKE